MIISEVRSVLSVVTVVLNKDDNNVDKKLLTSRPPGVMTISEVRSVLSVLTVVLNKDDSNVGKKFSSAAGQPHQR